jgi:head-tail adaptor
MNSGKLRHRITIQTRTNVTSNAGETSASWSEFGKRWAKVRQLGGTETENDAEAIEGRTNYLVTMRILDGMTTDMRILFGSLVLNVESIAADDTDKKTQFVRCIQIQETV